MDGYLFSSFAPFPFAPKFSLGGGDQVNPLLSLTPWNTLLGI